MNSPEREAAEFQTDRELGALPTPTGRVVDFAKRKRAIDLATLTDVRREMARVYREVRFKKIAPEVGAKLTFMLVSIAKVTEQAEVQPRVEAIERTLARQPQ
jgi:hypothetical protein